MNLRGLIVLAAVAVVCLLVFTDTVGGTAGWVLFAIVGLMAFAYLAQGLRR